MHGHGMLFLVLGLVFFIRQPLLAFRALRNFCALEFSRKPSCSKKYRMRFDSILGFPVQPGSPQESMSAWEAPCRDIHSNGPPTVTREGFEKKLQY